MPNYWFDHVHLISPDPIKTAEFYEKMFNASRVGIGEYPDGRINVRLNLNGTRVLIMNKETQPVESGASQIGLHHYGLGTDNIEATVDDLKAKGAKFTQEIVNLPIGVKYTFMRTPDDVLVELLERSG